VERDLIMMLRRAIIAGLALEWYPPATLADVLDWRVWCQCIDAGEATLTEQAQAAFEWAAQWLVSHDADGLATAITDLVEPAQIVPTLVQVCEAIADSATLPAGVVAEMATALDRQNEVPTDWTAPSMCTCPRCRRGLENPVGVTCAYDGIDWRALRALGQVAGIQDTTERPYIAQIRGVLAHAESRRLRYERQQREEREEYMGKLRTKGVIRG
jgi:hypothetical protein